jgi:hypothetical protein
MGKRLKYSELIKGISSCPSGDSREINSNIFRYVFEDLNHENNFKPVLLIEPARINSGKFD